jgi:iron complex outermembrane recepter protein
VKTILKLKQFCYLGVAGAICLLLTQPVKAQGKEKLDKKNLIAKDTVVKQVTKAEVANREIPTLRDLPRPHTSVKGWLAQETQSDRVIQVGSHFRNPDF